MEKSLDVLVNDIKRSLKSGEASLVLDRLHTYTTSILRKYCEKHMIKVTDDKGENLPINSLIGMLAKYYSDNKLISNFSFLSLKQSISIFNEFNNIRNNDSYAHVNDVLSNEESIYVVNCVTNMLDFLNYLEGTNSPNIRVNVVDKHDIYKYICMNEMTTSREIASHFNVPFDDIKDLLDELNFVDGSIKKGSILSDINSESCQWVKR